MIEQEEIIFACLEDLIPHHVDVVGEGPTRRLIVDTIQGKTPQTKKAEHGRHIDLSVPISDILSFAQLVISILGLYLQLKPPIQATRQSQSTVTPELINSNEEGTNNEEAFVRVVVENYGPGSPQAKIAVTVYQKARQSLRPAEPDG